LKPLYSLDTVFVVFGRPLTQQRRGIWLSRALGGDPFSEFWFIASHTASESATSEPERVKDRDG
jgi:hypothetical protein